MAVNIDYPVVTDGKGTIMHELGFISDEDMKKEVPTPSYRMAYIVNPEFIIQQVFQYPLQTGRNFHELLRSIQALQSCYNTGLLAPANWCVGEDLMISNDIPVEKYNKMFPLGHTIIKPYLKITPVPVSNESGGGEIQQHKVTDVSETTPTADGKEDSKTYNDEKKEEKKDEKIENKKK